MATFPKFRTEDGAEAFANGDKRIVPQDILVYEGVEAARAWYKGWDAANLAAPVPGLPELDYEPVERRCSFCGEYTPNRRYCTPCGNEARENDGI